jgi:DNA-binding transcriptional LysR family regulator
MAGSATRQLTERALAGAGVPYRAGMILEHTEAIKQDVLAWLGVAFLSVHAVKGELATGRLRGLRVRGLRPMSSAAPAGRTANATSRASRALSVSTALSA